MNADFVAEDRIDTTGSMTVLSRDQSRLPETATAREDVPHLHERFEARILPAYAAIISPPHFDENGCRHGVSAGAFGARRFSGCGRGSLRPARRRSVDRTVQCTAETR